MTRESRGYLLLILLAALGSVEFIFLGPFSYAYGYGAFLETIPTHLGLAKSGSVHSLWAPFIGCGFDRLSFWGNAAPFNLEPLLIWLFPPWLANGIHAFLQRTLASITTAVICRSQLKLSWNWSLIAGALHLAFSYYTFGAMFTSPALPLALYLISVIADHRLWLVLSILAGVAFSSLTTFIHGWPYIFIFSLLWFIFVYPKRTSKFWSTFGLFFISFAFGELPQLVALLYNAKFSFRSAFPIEAISWSLGGLFYYQPEFDYFNQDKIIRPIILLTGPLFLMSTAALALSRKAREGPYFSLLIRVGLLYALFSQKWLFVLAQKLTTTVLPWITGVYMGRFFMVPYPFLIAVMGAMLFEMISEVFVSNPQLIRLRSVFTIVVVIALTFLLFWPKIDLFYPTFINNLGERNYELQQLEVLRKDSGSFRVASVLPLQPSYAYAQGFETVDGWSNLYPRYYRELWLKVIEPVLNKIPADKQVLNPDKGRPQDNYIFLGLSLFGVGVGELPGENVKEAEKTGFYVTQRFNMKLLSLLNTKYLLSEIPLRGGSLRLISEPTKTTVLSLRKDYATGLVNASGTKTLPSSILTAFQDLKAALRYKRDGKEIYIYENTEVLPRFRTVSTVKVEPSNLDVVNALSIAEMPTLTSTAFLIPEEATELGISVSKEFSTECIINAKISDPDMVILDYRCTSPAFIIAAITWNPFWKAFIGGRQIPITRVNHAQMGLVVPAGKNHLILRYEPPYAGIIRPLFSLFSASKY